MVAKFEKHIVSKLSDLFIAFCSLINMLLTFISKYC